MVEKVVERVLRELDTDAWFAAVGEPLTDGERREALAYLQALELGECTLEVVDSWLAARDIADNPNWSHAWWDTELNEQKRLYNQLSAQHQEVAVLDALSQITERSAEVFYGPAAISAARAGVADQSLNRAAAGSASQACYQYSLALMAGAPSDHYFCNKFRLFLAGRWPLSVVDNTFYLF